MNYMYRGQAEMERVRRIQERRHLLKEIAKTAVAFAALLAALLWLPEF